MKCIMYKESLLSWKTQRLKYPKHVTCYYELKLRFLFLWCLQPQGESPRPSLATTPTLGARPPEP